MINLAQAARIEAMRLARNQVRQSIREEGRHSPSMPRVRGL
jgi:hypothetical protein